VRPLTYVPYCDLAGRPNVIVDGSATDGTRCTLSHWPHSGTPRALKADLSAEIAFNYLDTPAAQVDAEFVSNNHLDEDGVVGVYALVAPDHAQRHRNVLIEAARAGDFTTTQSRAGARLAFAIGALDERFGSYDGVLDALPAVLDDLDGARELWAEEDAQLEQALAFVERGGIAVEEHTDLDCSLVTADALPAHPIALYNAVRGFCVVTLVPGRPAIEYRYESWVQFVSRPVRARRDLRPLAATLSAEDGVEWTSDAPGDLTVTCAPRGASTLAPERVRDLMLAHLRDAPAAWDPFD
jgi:hypothetical protein